MAQNQNETQRRDLLREIEEIQSRIVEQNRAAATATGQELRALEDRIASERVRLQLQEDQLSVVEDILAEQQRIRQVEIDRNARQSEANDLQDDFTNSFARMSRTQQEFLTNSNNGNTAFASITAKILDLKQQEVDASDADRVILQQRRATLEAIRISQIEAAEAAAMTRQEMFGTSDAELRRIEFQQSIVGLSQDEADIAKQAFEAKENLLQQQERYNQLQNAGSEILGKLPAGLQSVIGGIKGMITGIRKFGIQAAIATAGVALVIGAIVAGLDYFTALDTAAKEFRDTTGLTNSQMEGIKSDANEIVGQFGNLGVEAKDVFNTVAALKSEFSDTVDFSKETVAALTVMNANFGVAAEDAAKVQGIMEQVGGLSSETAASVGLQAVNMAKAAGVAPAKVMKDIAENAEAASTFFKGDLTALTKNAIQARRMGSSLKEQVALSEKLLDFEGSIEEELVAATFVSGQFNLSRARALAFEGKTAEAAAETLKQIQRSGDFRKKDYFTQQQLAKASGMTVEEINKQLDTQDKLSKLSTEELAKAEKAIEQGLDITNINSEQLAQETEKFAAQQEQQATLDQLQNSFMGIAATVGSILVPLLESIVPIAALIAKPFQWMADGLSIITDNFAIMTGLLSAMAIYSGIIYGNKIKTFVLTAKQAIQEKIAAGFTLRGAIAGIFASLAKIPFGIGLIGAAAAVAGLVGLFSKAGDVMSPADGKTRISTKEGGLFELSPNDDLVAAPGAAAALAGGGVMSGDGSSNTINVDFSILSAPLNMMISEIKGLRADMASGKIGVYMDTEKVTSKIGRQVDSSTRNNFNLGQA